MSYLSRDEFEALKAEINVKIERIKWLDDSNPFENKEILKLKREVDQSLEYLKSFISPKLRLVK